MQRLADQHSGYVGNADSMAAFLRRWAAETGAPLPATGPAGPAGTLAFDARLPPSARDFHVARANTGFTKLFERRHPGRLCFADAAALVRFESFAPQDHEIWQLAFGDFEVSDDRYYRYDRSQESIFRGADLSQMPVLGAETGGLFLLMLPHERTLDGEAEALLLHHGGLIVRFTSFAHLLVHLYLEEREAFAGRDASLGHLYHYPGRLADTAAGAIIRVPD